MLVDELEIKKQTLLMPFYAEAGAALLECQTLELGIGLLLHYLSRKGIAKITVEQTLAIMENRDKKTLGQLIGLLNNNLNVSDDAEVKLTEALRARNILVHRFLIENCDKTANHISRGEVIKALQALCVKVRQGRDIIHPVIHKLELTLEGFDSAAYLRGLDKFLS